MPKVSVIIPCYNQGHYVLDAVQCVLDQTYDDFEIIVVNDGSTDPKTVEILNNLDRPKTTVLHTDNMGLASARNNGIRQATGKYILPLDADDRIGKEYLEEAVKILDENPEIGIVYCEAKYFGAKEGLWDLPDFDMSTMLANNIIFCSGFFRKKDWERVGGYQPNMVYGWEDWDFWLSIIELGRKVYRIPKVLFHYRVAESSMIGEMSADRQFFMRLHVCTNHRDLYKNVTTLKLSPKITRLFVDTGSGFNDKESMSQVVHSDIKEIEFDVSGFSELRSVRFDPVNDAAYIKLKSMTAVTDDDRQVKMAVLKSNAYHGQDKRFIFTDTDPWIQLKTPETGVTKLRIEIEYIAMGSETFKHVLEQKYKVMMEQAEQIRSQLDRIDGQSKFIRTQGDLIRNKSDKIKAKDVHIHNLETELQSIKSLFIWRVINMMRLIKRTAETLKSEGFEAFWKKTKNYIRRRAGRPNLEMLEKDYTGWVKRNELTESRINKIKKNIRKLRYKPKISLVMPVYNVAQEWLEKAIESVINQLYDNWELCIADDASTEAHVKTTIGKYTEKDTRIKAVFLPENKGISLASNEALSLATGEFIGLLDNDDELTVHALYENVKLLNDHPDADMIYSDEDKIDLDGKRCQPHFKPDWAPDMFLSHMYTCHFGVYRRRIVEEIGGFRKGYEGSQDYDLVLRFIERTDKIHHIPKVLYHWRIIPGSAAQSTNAKSYAYVAAHKALSDYMERNRINGDVSEGLFLGSFRVRREIEGTPEVSIMIPFRDKASILKTCVHSIFDKTEYKNYKILLVNNGSVETEMVDFLEEIEKNPLVKVLDHDRPFNYSEINNTAVANTNSEYILFLNNDMEVISPQWIEAMLEHAQRPEVGCAGALLYYPDDTVQHGGVILGLGGVAGHSHSRCRRDSFGYMGRLKVINNLSAVTAACLMMRRTVFEEIGGFDENVTHAFNDVDLCLKMRKKGYLIVYTPYAELYHHESLSRGYEDTTDKKERFNREVDYIYRKWGKVLEKGDPYYNPNLTLTNGDFSVR